MRFKYFFIVLITALTFNLSAKENQLYANIYADQLIEKFDDELSLVTDTSYLTSPTYLKLLAAREYLEHSHAEVSNFGATSLVMVRKAGLYKQVKSVIDYKASLMKLRLDKNQKRMQGQSVLYPSIKSHGNLTGNTFPENVWSLTFDDGPHSSRTQKVVDNLYEREMKATFFVLNKNADRFPRAMDYVLSHNMELALHSFNHLNLAKESDRVREFEITQAKEELEAGFKSRVKLFRLPYGAGMRDKDLRTIIAKNEMIHVFWNVDTLDWKDKDPKSIFERTKKQMERTPKKSGIILFHDIHPQTVIASEMVMNYLIEKESTVCTVGDVVSFHNSEPQNCISH